MTASLTRSASLDDYEDCISVADWQQRLAIDAYWRWRERTSLYGAVLCLNWGAASFRAPGAAPIYRGYREGPDLTDPPEPLAALFALSVLDRIARPLRLLHFYADRLEPGGLIVCTFAAWNATGEDCAVGCELRSRIYDRESWGTLLHESKRIGLEPLGGVDLRYRGDTLGDHTLASLVMVKGSDHAR